MKVIEKTNVSSHFSNFKHKSSRKQSLIETNVGKKLEEQLFTDFLFTEVNKRYSK